LATGNCRSRSTKLTWDNAALISPKTAEGPENWLTNVAWARRRNTARFIRTSSTSRFRTAKSPHARVARARPGPMASCCPSAGIRPQKKPATTGTNKGFQRLWPWRTSDALWTALRLPPADDACHCSYAGNREACRRRRRPSRVVLPPVPGSPACHLPASPEDELARGWAIAEGRSKVSLPVGPRDHGQTAVEPGSAQLRHRTGSFWILMSVSVPSGRSLCAGRRR